MRSSPTPRKSPAPCGRAPWPKSPSADSDDVPVSRTREAGRAMSEPFPRGPAQPTHPQIHGTIDLTLRETSSKVLCSRILPRIALDRDARAGQLKRPRAGIRLRVLFSRYRARRSQTRSAAVPALPFAGSDSAAPARHLDQPACGAAVLALQTFQMTV